MPTRTIYVSEIDLPLYDRARSIFEGNLSAAITRGLQGLVESNARRREGYGPVTLVVGVSGERRKRFFGSLLAEWSREVDGGEEHLDVYRTRNGRWVVHRIRPLDGPHPTGEMYQELMIAERRWDVVAATATLEVHDTLEALRTAVPIELADQAAERDPEPDVEELDI